MPIGSAVAVCGRGRHRFDARFKLITRSPCRRAMRGRRAAANFGSSEPVRMAELCLVQGYTIDFLTQEGSPVAVAPFCRVIVDSYGHECVRRGVTRVRRVSGGERPELFRSPQSFPGTTIAFL